MCMRVECMAGHAMALLGSDAPARDRRTARSRRRVLCTYSHCPEHGSPTSLARTTIDSFTRPSSCSCDYTHTYKSLALTIAVEFALLTVPTAIAFTHAELVLPLLASVYFSALVLNVLSWKHAREFVHKHCRKEKMNALLERELPFLTCYRAQIMHSTYVRACY